MRPGLPMLAVLATVAALVAQDPLVSRYELGKRLRRFERAWADATPTAAARAEAAQAMQRAVRAFFGLDLSRVGHELDDGSTSLLADEDARPVFRRLAGLVVRPARRLVAPRDELVVEIDDPSDAPWPGEGALRIELTGVGEAVAADVASPATWPLRLVLRAPADSGDLALRARFSRDDSIVDFPEQLIAVVADAAARFASLETASRVSPASAVAAPAELALERGSLDGLVNMLRPIVGGRTTETDVPAARLFAEAEELVVALATARRVYGDQRAGEFWLRIPIERRSATVRMFAPTREPGETAPRALLLALHGMGGTENLFFDGYGDGAARRLCEAAGWLLCAPRSMNAGDAGPLVDALAARYAIDRSRVYVVGHSMGAGTAIAAAQRFPALFGGLAALGGGGSLADPEAIAELPVFVGVGVDDFALAGARGLARGLKRAGVANVELREYPGIEHLLIVQAALPDVLAFFRR